MTSPTARSALDAYLAHHGAAVALVVRIGDALANHDDAPAEEITWAHVGDIAETERALRQIADRLFGEGEYAPEAR